VRLLFVGHLDTRERICARSLAVTDATAQWGTRSATVRGFSSFPFVRYGGGGRRVVGTNVVYDASGAQPRFPEDGRCGRRQFRTRL